jgi:hypothetical protein
MREPGGVIVAPGEHQDVLVTPSIKPQSKPIQTEKDILFDSIASESSGEESASDSVWQTALTGLLWVGYGIAIAVALILVWSAAKELLH